MNSASAKRRMSIHRVQSMDDSQSTVRRAGRQPRRRNGLANILSGLSSEEVQGLRSLGDSVVVNAPQAHPAARRGSAGTLGISTEQLENLSLQRRRSINGESTTVMANRHIQDNQASAAGVLSSPLAVEIRQDSLLALPTSQGPPLRLSPASSLRALEEEVVGQGRNGDAGQIQRVNIPNSNYLRRRRNAVSYVNPTQFFLDTLVAQATAK